jgi:hypothetical protein
MGWPLRMTALNSAERKSFWKDPELNYQKTIAGTQFCLDIGSDALDGESDMFGYHLEPEKQKALGDYGIVFCISNSVVRDRIAELDAGDMEINPVQGFIEYYRKAADAGKDLFGTVDCS